MEFKREGALSAQRRNMKFQNVLHFVLVSSCLTSCERQRATTLDSIKPLDLRLIPVRHVTPRQAAYTLNNALKSSRPFFAALEIEHRNSIIVSSSEPSDCLYASQIIEEIDHPTTCAATKFVKVEHADLEALVTKLSTEFLNDAVTLQVIADHKTNRIFLMGTLGQLGQAEALIHLEDKTNPVETSFAK